jgi:hypothetical protein
MHLAAISALDVWVCVSLEKAWMSSRIFFELTNVIKGVHSNEKIPIGKYCERDNAQSVEAPQDGGHKYFCSVNNTDFGKFSL